MAKPSVQVTIGAADTASSSLSAGVSMGTQWLHALETGRLLQEVSIGPRLHFSTPCAPDERYKGWCGPSTSPFPFYHCVV